MYTGNDPVEGLVSAFLFRALIEAGSRVHYTTLSTNHFQSRRCGTMSVVTYLTSTDLILPLRPWRPMQVDVDVGARFGRLRCKLI